MQNWRAVDFAFWAVAALYGTLSNSKQERARMARTVNEMKRDYAAIIGNADGKPLQAQHGLPVCKTADGKVQ